jgi:hypothetical protein
MKTTIVLAIVLLMAGLSEATCYLADNCNDEACDGACKDTDTGAAYYFMAALANYCGGCGFTPECPPDCGIEDLGGGLAGIPLTVDQFNYYNGISILTCSPFNAVSFQGDCPTPACDFNPSGDWIVTNGQECLLTTPYWKASGNVLVQGEGTVLVIDNSVLRVGRYVKIVVQDGGKLVIRNGGKICGGDSC